MRVMRQRGTPCVQHRHEADASAEMLGIRRDRERGLGRGFEQQVVDHRLVLIGDVADLRRQRVHHMEIRHRQELGFALGQPLACGSALTLGAVPIAAAIVGDDGVSARLVLTAPDMTLIWPRLTWPALAWRHAAPWSRKISATSSNRRDMAAMRSAGLCCPSLWLSWASYEAATVGQAGSRCRRSGQLRRACSAPSCPICRDPATPGWF